MFARAALVTMAAGWLGCYDVPQPACGFACGPAGACPRSYTCNPADNVCHLEGAPAQTCPGIDAGLDADESAPFVISHAPQANAVGVATTTNISAVFSEPVVGINETSVVVFVDDVEITGTVSYTENPPTMVYDPDPLLPPSSTVIVGIQYPPDQPSLFQIFDLAGTPLTPLLWQFTIAADVTPPMVNSTTPVDQATGVAPSAFIGVQFTERVTNVTAASFVVVGGGAIAGTLASSSGGVVWTFTPDAPLPAATTFTLTLTTAITDLASPPNALAAPFSLSFTTL